MKKWTILPEQPYLSSGEWIATAGKPILSIYSMQGTIIEKQKVKIIIKQYIH